MKTVAGMPYILVSDETDSTVVIEQETAQVCAIEDETRVIEIIVPGVQGPQGPPGISGAGFDFTQASVASTWTINHNLGFRPLIQTRTAGGMNMWGQVQHLSVNVTQITFTEPIAGTARLT